MQPAKSYCEISTERLLDIGNFEEVINKRCWQQIKYNLTYTGLKSKIVF